MSRNLRIPALVLLFFAFVLLFLVSISLPYLTALDFVRIHTSGAGSAIGAANGAIEELRFGIWAPCAYLVKGGRQCPHLGHGYSVLLQDIEGHVATVASSWTRGLAIHPVCTIVTFAAFGLSLTSRFLHASLVSFLASFITLIAFAIDIALYVHVKNQAHSLLSVNSSSAPAFWMTFASLIFLIFSGCAMWVVHRSDDYGGSSYAMSSSDSWFSRFRK